MHRNGSIRAVAANALRFRVIAPVAIQAVRAAARPTRLAAYRRDRLDQPPELRDLIHVGGGRRRDQRHALPIGQDVMLAPLFPSVHGAGAGPFATAQGPHERSVDGRAARPVDLVGGVQLGQEDLVELLRRPRRLASREAVASRSCRCRSRSPAAGTPRDASLEDEEDAMIALRLSKGLPTGESEPRGLGGGSNGSIRFQSSSDSKGLAMGAILLRDTHFYVEEARFVIL